MVSHVVLCRQTLGPDSAPSPPSVLEINGAGVISQQPALSSRTNQCDHEDGESSIVFKESECAAGELVTFALSSSQQRFGRSVPGREQTLKCTAPRLPYSLTTRGGGATVHYGSYVLIQTPCARCVKPYRLYINPRPGLLGRDVRSS